MACRPAGFKRFVGPVRAAVQAPASGSEPGRPSTIARMEIFAHNVSRFEHPRYSTPPGAEEVARKLKLY